MHPLISTICLFCLLTTQAIAADPADTNISALYSPIADENGFALYPHSDVPDVYSSSQFSMPLCNGIVVEEVTIDQLQRHMQSGVLTATILVKCLVARITQVESYVNPVLQLNPDYLNIAAQLDHERAAGEVRGPLHGIPFLIKDNIASRDRMETTAGSWALLGSIVPRDAFVVRSLRAAGALLLGKATLSEWADMRSSNYSEGYSARGGQARSAYNFTVNPGGSSSGCAIAVSCNIVPFAIGTETDGSGVRVIPESVHQDSVGTFGKSVKDAVLALDGIFGIDPRDNYTLSQAGRTPLSGYVHSIANRSVLRQARFGIPWRTFWKFADQDQLAQLLDLVNSIESAGAQIINGTELPDANLTVSPNGWDWKYGCERGRPDQCEYTVITVDFYNNIRKYLSELKNTKMRSLEDIVRYNYDNDGTEGGSPGVNPAFASGQDSFIDSLRTKGEMNGTYWAALNWTQETTRWQIDSALNSLGARGPLDALLVPSDVGQSYQIADQAGYPVITIPAGMHTVSHMPFGLALVNTAFSEATLVKWASAIEDLQISLNTAHQRLSPTWKGYLGRNLPVINA